MNLQHIPLDRLTVSAVNMRHEKALPDITDLLPSVKARGILVPLLVRPNGSDDTFEIVAGRRRFHAAKAAELDGPLPCAVLSERDDADALEASLIENLARLDPDPMTEFEAFRTLHRKGRSVADIAMTFGISEPHVRQRLALGALLPSIRKAYRQDRIDGASLRHLTLATKAQQKAWWKRFTDPDEQAPTGRALKRWLFGGEEIATDTALFPLETYPGKIVSDLFEDTAYFDDAETFWPLQNTAIAELKQRYLDQGWTDVELIDPDTMFQSWLYRCVAKDEGGHVIIDIACNGEVTIHEGRLHEAELRRRAAAADGSPKTSQARGELSRALENYVGLHRHAMVRAELIGRCDIALRLIVAHILTGTTLWTVSADPVRAQSEATAASVKASSAAKAFETERSAVCDLLGFPFDAEPLARGYGSAKDLVGYFKALMELDDAAVLRILTFLMAETLEAGHAAVELAASELAIDPAKWWQPDDAFFDLVRNKAAINAMIAEVKGPDAAAARLTETRKRQLADLQSALSRRGEDETWTPAYLRVPFETYTGQPGGSLGEARDIARGDPD